MQAASAGISSDSPDQLWTPIRQEIVSGPWELSKGVFLLEALSRSGEHFGVDFLRFPYLGIFGILLHRRTREKSTHLGRLPERIFQAYSRRYFWKMVVRAIIGSPVLSWEHCTMHFL